MSGSQAPSRTLLYDIGRGAWDAEICGLLDIPMALLPEVRDCAGDFGTTDPDILGHALPIRGVAGDQQAATIGQACFSPGMLKSTYGTGCFALLNTGAERVASRHRLLTTIAHRLADLPRGATRSENRPDHAHAATLAACSAAVK